MQTFLPYPSVTQSAIVLDRQRLGKQRVEAREILRILTKQVPWKNHPVIRMWEGFEHALAVYGWTMCDEWIRRGYQDTCRFTFLEVLGLRDPNSIQVPPWIGNSDFHISHQSNLIRKRPDLYAHLFPGVPDNLPYVWPRG